MEFSKDIIGKSLVAIIVGFFIFCFLMGVIVKEVPLSLHDVLWTFLCLIPILTILRVFELFNITPKLTGFIGKILHHVGNAILKIILFSAMGIFLILALSVGLYGIFLLFGCMGYWLDRQFAYGFWYLLGSGACAFVAAIFCGLLATLGEWKDNLEQISL